jgi:hypothetical protein
LKSKKVTILGIINTAEQNRTMLKFRFLFTLLFSAFFLVSYSQIKEIKLHGKNYGRNLILSNPFAADGVGFSIVEIKINGKIPYIEIAGSVFEIDFTACGVKLNDSIHLSIKHKAGSVPALYNPECITDANLEAIPSLDNSSENKSYYLKDKSLCIIKGKVVSEKKGDFHNNYELILKVPNSEIVYGIIPTDSNSNYVGVLQFDHIYELQISDYTYGKIRKKVLLDLRGVPQEKKKGELIFVNFNLPQIKDQRIENLNSEFPNNKLYYDPVSQTLKWDEDFYNAISKASQFLIKQIGQEKNLQEVELDRKSKQLEIAQNKSDLAEKSVRIQAQNNELIEQKLDKEIREHELQSKSLLISEEQNKRKQLFVALFLVLLITVTSIFAFLRQRKLKQQVDIQRKLAEQQKQIVEEKQKEILDSIHYAKRIQNALITNSNYIQKHLSRLQNNGKQK